MNLPSPLVYLTPDGRYRLLGRGGDDEAVFRESFVENVYRLRPEHFSEHKLCLDLGANIGAFSVLAASMGARVYAYEPEEENFELLLLNARLCGENIVPIKKAIGAEIGTSFIIPRRGGTAASTAPIDGHQPVETVRLVDCFADNALSYVDVLKCDVEGAEYDIFLAAPQDVVAKARHIFIEFHPPTGTIEGNNSAWYRWGSLIAKLSETHKLQILGAWNVTGGYIWAERY